MKNSKSIPLNCVTVSLTTKKKVQLTNSFLNIVIITTHNSSVDLECPYLTSTSLIKKLMVLIKSQLDRTKNMNNNTSFNDLETFFLELSPLPSVTFISIGFCKTVIMNSQEYITPPLCIYTPSLVEFFPMLLNEKLYT